MSKFWKIISSKIFLAVALFLLVSVIFLEIKQWRQRKIVEQEIDSLNSQSEALSQKNNQLQSALSFLQTDEYKQMEAREKFNLAEPGEVVYSFQADDSANQGQDQGKPSYNPDSNQISNPGKWWNYFFHKN